MSSKNVDGNDDPTSHDGVASKRSSLVFGQLTIDDNSVEHQSLDKAYALVAHSLRGTPVSSRPNVERKGSDAAKLSKATGENRPRSGSLWDSEHLSCPFTPGALDQLQHAVKPDTETAKLNDALQARDAAVQRLIEANSTIRRKNAIIDSLEIELEEIRKAQSSLAGEREKVAVMEKEASRLRQEVAQREYELEHMKQKLSVPAKARNTSGGLGEAPLVPPAPGLDAVNSAYQPSYNPFSESPTSDALAMISDRNRILADFPIPSDVPETVHPILFPPSMTLQDFLLNVSGSLRDAGGQVLSNHRVLQLITTSWCPEREEHGYTLTPAFLCNTNPKVVTAHAWEAVNVSSKCGDAVDCFYNKDGVWYYAGIYKEFRMNDLSTLEWNQLSPETTSQLVKETIAARKNVSAQNMYETSQLYAAGALRVACVGLQCTGFNTSLYYGMLECAIGLTARERSSGRGSTSGRSTPVGGSRPGSSLAMRQNSSSPLPPPLSMRLNSSSPLPPPLSLPQSMSPQPWNSQAPFPRPPFLSRASSSWPTPAGASIGDPIQPRGRSVLGNSDDLPPGALSGASLWNAQIGSAAPGNPWAMGDLTTKLGSLALGGAMINGKSPIDSLRGSENLSPIGLGKP